MAFRPTLDERWVRLLPLREVGVVLLLLPGPVPVPALLPCVLRLEEEVLFGVSARVLGTDTTFVFALVRAPAACAEAPLLWTIC